MDSRVIQDGERFALDRLADIYPGSRPVIFDVGAHDGDYAREVFQRIPDARVWCFEPQPDVLVDLRAWAGPCYVTVVPVALSDSDEPIELHATREGHCYLASAHRTFDRPSGRVLDRDFAVPAMTLDAYCVEQEIDHIDLLKIDVEGHEPWVLLGAESLLSHRAIDLIQFEMSDCAAMAGWTFEDMRAALAHHGFEIYVETPKSLRPTSDFPLGHFDDLQDYVNMLAVSETCAWWRA